MRIPSTFLLISFTLPYSYLIILKRFSKCQKCMNIKIKVNTLLIGLPNQNRPLFHTKKSADYSSQHLN